MRRQLAWVVGGQSYRRGGEGGGNGQRQDVQQAATGSAGVHHVLLARLPDLPGRSGSAGSRCGALPAGGFLRLIRRAGWR